MWQGFLITFALLITSNSVLAEQNNLASQILNYETVEIKPGEFDLYVPIPSFYKVEHVKKRVVIKKPFAIGKYEVSNAQWNQCHQMGGCAAPAKLYEGEKDNHPVVRVTWHDAYQFSKWLSKVSGKKYRLPTEEEWSYAVYEGKTHKEVEVNYDYSDLEKIRLVIKKTKPRGYYKANNWGVADSLGNVWEWTLTCWYASEANILKEYSPDAVNSPTACYTRIALGENRSHIPDFISDTYSGGCATLRPAANLGFRLVEELV